MWRLGYDRSFLGCLAVQILIVFLFIQPEVLDNEDRNLVNENVM